MNSSTSPSTSPKSVMIKFFKIMSATALVTFAASCTPVSNPTTANPNATKPLKATHVNPYQPGTYDFFVTQSKYPKTYDVYKNKDLLSRTNDSNSSIVIDMSKQRAKLLNNGVVAMDYPVSTGTSKFPTPSGDYKIIEKIAQDKRSTAYGKILDSEGKTVKRNADSRKHKDLIPEGGKFQGAAMPYWMRLTWDGIGMHRGNVPRYPASHGCIRTPGSVVSTVFRKTRIGTPVSIVR